MMTAMRYQVRVCEGEDGMSGRVIANYATLRAAKRRAERDAHDYYYGTIIHDTRTGLIDYGDSGGFIPKLEVMG